MFLRCCRALIAVLLALLPSTGIVSTHAASRMGAQKMTLTMESYLQGDPYIPVMIKQYEASHPGITIKQEPVAYADILSKVLQQAAAHSMPDIVALNNPQTPAVAQAGALADLGPFTKGWSQLKGYYKNSLATVMWQGKMYGLPMKHNDLALFYNVKMLKAAGINRPPATWAELRTDAKKLTHGHVYGMGLSAINGVESPWQLEPFLWSNGSDLHTIANKGGVEALTLWKQLLDDGSMSKNALNWGEGDLGNQFVAGNLAMMVNGPWELPALNAAKGLRYGITYIPRPRANLPPSTPLGGEVWTISSLVSPARQQAAWDFIKWTQNPKRLSDFMVADGELSAYPPSNASVVERNPGLKVFAAELPYARFQGEDFGPNIPQAYQAVQTAIQDALTGRQSVQQALQTAQSTIASLH